MRKRPPDAENQWKKVHREREIPGDIERVRNKRVSEPVWLPGLLKEIGMVPSTSEGRRVIEQGGVYVSGDGRLDKIGRRVPFCREQASSPSRWARRSSKRSYSKTSA